MIGKKIYIYKTKNKHLRGCADPNLVLRIK